MTKLFTPLCAAMIPLVLIATPAFAQETLDGRTFDAAYFEQYAPSTALDILGRIPGFQLDEGDSKRGLGQGGANVLINGQRLTGKSDDAFEQVGRIAAQNVVKIDIVDGTSLNIPGLSGQVANIITKSTGLTGTWQWQPEWRDGFQANLGRGFVTVSGKTGDLDYTAKLKVDAYRNGNAGSEQRLTANRQLFEIRDESARWNGDSPGGSLNLTWVPKEDHIGNLNLEYNQFNFNNLVVSDLTAITAQGEDGQHIFSRAEDEWNAKIDGDYELPFAQGKLKLIGYYRAEDSPTVSRFDAYSLTAPTESSRYFQDADEGEAIARTEYSWSPQPGRDWTLAAEGAFNFLDIEARFVDLLNSANSDPAFTRSRVEEKRGEATLTHSRSISPKWDIQVSGGAEYSELSQAAQTREFFRPKGFVSATYKPNDSFNIRTKLEREVGQLNFFDFISSVSLDDNLNTTGNPDIVPSQSWVGEVEFDKQFTGGHSFKARFYGEKISDLVDRIPIGINGDAVGNIDSAERYGVDFDATIKGDPWGMKGVELNLELDLRDSNVEDPVEFFARRLNDDKTYYWSTSLRHDIPNSDWAWGFYADQFKESATYRLSTFNQYTFDGPFGVLFLEHKDVFGMKIKADWMNIFKASDDFYREIYTDRRDIGTLDVIEDRTRPFGYFFRLTVSDTF